MIHDLQKRDPGAIPSYDVCIVGSGPAGGTVANELVGSGLRVCVLESGRMKPTPHGDRLREVRSLGIRIKDYSRERTLGGASTTWAGLSSPLDQVDFEPRPGVRRSGWPIARDELLPYYRRAAEGYRFPDLRQFGPDGFATLKLQGDLRPEWRSLEEKVFLAAEDPQDFGRELRHIYERDVDLYLDATVLRFEGESRAVSHAVVRSSAGRTYEVRARAFVLACGGIENARLLLNSRSAWKNGLGNEHDQVGRCMMNHPKAYFGVVELSRPVRELPFYFGCLAHGFAGYGGIRLKEDEQRRLGVLNSYVRLEPLYPWSDNPGVEAFVFLVKRSRFLLRAWRARRRGQVTSIRDYSETGDDSELQNRRKTAFDWIRLPLLVLRHFPQVARYAWSRTLARTAPRVKRARVRNFMEMEPREENRVTLSEELDPYGQPLPLVRHECSDLDRKSLIALHRVFQSEIERNGLGVLKGDLERAQPWPITEDASHHLGTTRMGGDPRTSVVDRNCRVHGVENVYAAGGSVFPTSGCANPTFTIVALSIRLAEHLRREVFGIVEAPEVGAGGSAAGKRAILIGSGRRVLDAALPVFARLEDRFEIAGIYARRPRVVRFEGREHPVKPLLDLRALDGVDLVYVAVSKPAVPAVLAHLAALRAEAATLVIDTPVVLFKHYRHARLAAGFREAWVAEDCATLPWIDLVRRAEADLVGPLRELEFERSAWRYHGFALARTLFSDAALESARRRFEPAGEDGRPRTVFELRFAGGRVARIVEPRDYDTGTFVLRGERGFVTDDPSMGGDAHLIEPILDGDRCLGFRLGEAEERLRPDEVDLMGRSAATRVTAWMEGNKRVGLLRLLRRIDEGEGGYPLDDALEDMIVDYLLEKTGRYRASLGARSRLFRGALEAFSRVVGR